MTRTAGRVGPLVLAAVLTAGLLACSGMSAVHPTPAAPDPTTPAKDSSPASAPTTPATAPTAQAAAAGWRLEFTGPAGEGPPAGFFTARVGGNGWGNHELQSYTARPANAALDGAGHLVLHARREHYRGADGFTREWTSARLDTLGKWAFRTGTLSLRVSAPAAAGTWPALWLMGSDIVTVGWPRCGELDIAELVGASGLVHHTVHGPAADGRPYAQPARPVSARTRLADPAAFHVYSVTRTARRITFRVDGRVTGRLTPANLRAGQRWVFDEPMFLTVNLAIGGWPGAPTAATPADERLVVDWIGYQPA